MIKGSSLQVPHVLLCDNTPLRHTHSVAIVDVLQHVEQCSEWVAQKVAWRAPNGEGSFQEVVGDVAAARDNLHTRTGGQCLVHSQDPCAIACLLAIHRESKLTYITYHATSRESRWM